MKKIIFLLAAIALTSCAVYIPREQYTLTGFTDYRPFTSEGFYITPDPIYPEGCQTLGELRIVHYPEEEQIQDERYDRYESHSYHNGRWWGFVRPAYVDLLREAVYRAQSIGATGLVKFNIVHVPGDSVSRPSYIVTGVCIK